MCKKEVVLLKQRYKNKSLHKAGFEISQSKFSVPNLFPE